MRWRRWGVSGINNFPTVGLLDGRFRQELEETNLGFSREVAMIQTAHDLGLFTIVYAFNPADSEQMAGAGADVIIAHMGLTVGGTTGIRADVALAYLRTINVCAMAERYNILRILRHWRIVP